MARTSNIVSGIHYLKLAEECFADFIREHPGTKGANLFAGYNKKIRWILTDLITHQAFPDAVRAGIKEEINSDVFVIPELMDKISQLWPEQRIELEKVVDELIIMRKAAIVNNG